MYICGFYINKYFTFYANLGRHFHVILLVSISMSIPLFNYCHSGNLMFLICCQNIPDHSQHVCQVPFVNTFVKIHKIHKCNYLVNRLFLKFSLRSWRFCVRFELNLWATEPRKRSKRTQNRQLRRLFEILLFLLAPVLCIKRQLFSSTCIKTRLLLLF